MAAGMPYQTILWVIGVIQPASVGEVCLYLEALLADAGDVPDEHILRHICLGAMNNGYLIRVSRQPDLFSLSLKGNRRLTRKQRMLRDRARLLLLKEVMRDRIHVSREVEAGRLGGVAPSVDFRTTQQVGSANQGGSLVPREFPCWPRLPRQLFTGSSPTSRDDYLRYLSFATLEQLAISCQSSVKALTLDHITSGLMLGVSPKLIQQLAWRPERHYRSFELAKRGGGFRTIDSPRVFLKVVQRFLADYILVDLPVCKAVHSYRIGSSIQENANQHTSADFVANIDIENFFGSIKRSAIDHLLLYHGFKSSSSELIAWLVTKDDALPQGAPTSPGISNAFLYLFDEFMAVSCKNKNLSYSRYADDITISGNDRGQVSEMLTVAKSKLMTEYGLRLNEAKSRIASKHGQQKVTGLVVNERVAPARSYRRKIRAAFNNAKKQESITEKGFQRLQGYVSYLKSFDALRNSADIRRYEGTLRSLARKG